MNNHKYKIGDVVEFIKDYHIFNKGDVRIIREINEDDIDPKENLLDFEGESDANSAFAYRVKLHIPKTESKKIHPHHDVIIAWLNGNDVEIYNPVSEEWYYIYDVDVAVKDRLSVPSFMISDVHRIKPKPSEKELEIQKIENEIKELENKLNELKGDE